MVSGRLGASGEGIRCSVAKQKTVAWNNRGGIHCATADSQTAVGRAERWAQASGGNDSQRLATLDLAKCLVYSWLGVAQRIQVVFFLDSKVDMAVVTVNVHEAKTQLSRLLVRVSRGEEVVIARAGKPVARLVPFVPQPMRRVAGSVRGQVWIAPDFDASLPNEVLEAFEA